MVFEPETLAPGPGIGVQAMATFRWCLFQSALSGSGVFHAYTSVGGHDCTEGFSLYLSSRRPKLGLWVGSLREEGCLVQEQRALRARA